MDEINFTGGVDLEGQFTTGSFTGVLAGNASYSFNKEFSFEAYSAELFANFYAGFNFNGNIQIQETGFSGNLNVQIDASGKLGVRTAVYSDTVKLVTSCLAEVSYANNQVRLKGTLKTDIDLHFYEKNY